MNKVLEELKKIEKENGVLTPEAVVEEAESSISPLHSLFEWDDAKAGHAHRIWQARRLINAQVVLIKGREVEAYHNLKVRIKNVEVQGYFSTERILSNKAMYQQVLSMAIKELKYWQTKYENLKELQGIIDVEKLEKVRKENGN